MSVSKAHIRYEYDTKKWVMMMPNPDIEPTSRVLLGSSKQQIDYLPNTSSSPRSSDDFMIHIRPSGANIYRAGPLIGILSVARGNRLLGNRANFIDIIRTGKELGALVFVFTPDDIEWDAMQMQGRFYHFNQRRWHTLTIPFPDVVYNRVPNRDYEKEPVVVNTIAKLQNTPNLHLFNPHFFDKGSLYDILQRSSLQQYIPESIRLTNFQSLLQLQKKYGSLYLKPSTGKAGNGIYRLHSARNQLHLQSSFGGKKTNIKIVSTTHLRRLLQSFISKKDYIAQQAIALLTYKGNPFDVRVLVQKNGKGEWDVSGIGFRVAGKDGITTHVPQGGKIIDRTLALDPYFGIEGSTQLLHKVRDIAIKIAATLNEHYSTLGEMSMDFGVTANQELWFFEANAKPMKFDEPQIRRTSLRRIIEYSKYLSQF